MTIRLLDFGQVGSLRSLAIFHGVGYAMREDTPDTITITRPADPFVSIGHHQDAKTEVDLEYCREEGIPVYRREIGGGAVGLDEGQTFWHTIFHQSRVPTTLADVYTRFLAGPVLALNRIGIPAVHRPVNDIQVEGRKIGPKHAAGQKKHAEPEQAKRIRDRKRSHKGVNVIGAGSTTSRNLWLRAKE